MAISGKQTINIGLPNESANSDSLYAAFTKTKDNFTTLFACASPYNTFIGNSGIGVTANSSTGIVAIGLGSDVSLAGVLTLSGSQNLTNGGEVDLSVCSSVIALSSNGADIATLNTGVNGQIKTIVLNEQTDATMTITVFNPGWKNSGNGTMTFTKLGDGCTLQFISNKWFCIGNNGVVFA